MEQITPPARLRPRPQVLEWLRAGAVELLRGITAWRAWLALGENDVKRRYRRSRLGQLWFTLSMAIFIFGLATILGGLFKSNLTAILPWFAINMVMWAFISTVLNESANSFVEAESFMKQVDVPHCAYIIRIIYRNMLILAHNIIIIPIILIYAWVPVNGMAFLSVLGLMLTVLQLLWIGIILATLSARFRDIPQVVQNGVQLLFFLTPIMFKPEQLPDDLWAWLKWNPIQSQLALIRDPLLGELPAMWDYAYVLTMIVIGFAMALTFLGRFRNRIVYWI